MTGLVIGKNCPPSIGPSPLHGRFELSIAPMNNYGHALKLFQCSATIAVWSGQFYQVIMYTRGGAGIEPTHSTEELTYSPSPNGYFPRLISSHGQSSFSKLIKCLRSRFSVINKMRGVFALNVNSFFFFAKCLKAKCLSARESYFSKEPLRRR